VKANKLWFHSKSFTQNKKKRSLP